MTIIRQQRGKIPEFKSKEEEARFWDSHDFTDYPNEFKPVRVRFARNLSQGITIRLDPETLGVLRFQAHEKGVGPTTLARMWILEHLREQGLRSTPKQAEPFCRRGRPRVCPPSPQGEHPFDRLGVNSGSPLRVIIIHSFYGNLH